MFKRVLTHRDWFMVPQSPLPEALPLLDQAMMCLSSWLPTNHPVRDYSFPADLSSRVQGRKTLPFTRLQSKDRRQLDLSFTTLRFLKANKTLSAFLGNLDSEFSLSRARPKHPFPPHHPVQCHSSYTDVVYNLL